MRNKRLAERKKLWKVDDTVKRHFGDNVWVERQVCECSTTHTLYVVNNLPGHPDFERWHDCISELVGIIDYNNTLTTKESLNNPKLRCGHIRLDNTPNESADRKEMEGK